MKVFVVEKVSYDYYRFNDIIGIANCLPGADAIANKFNDARREEDKLPIVIDDNNYCNLLFDSSETYHLYIREFEVQE